MQRRQEAAHNEGQQKPPSLDELFHGRVLYPSPPHCQALAAQLVLELAVLDRLEYIVIGRHLVPR